MKPWEGGTGWFLPGGGPGRGYRARPAPARYADFWIVSRMSRMKEVCDEWQVT